MKSNNQIELADTKVAYCMKFKSDVYGSVSLQLDYRRNAKRFSESLLLSR